MAPTDQTETLPPEPAGGPTEPTFDECHAEHIRYHDDLQAGRLDLAVIPDGHYLAYHGGRIHGHDRDPVALQHRVAAALGVHWALVVIDYPWA